jgi:hypothetical protein
VVIGTHLNVDDQAAVRVLVGPYAVEFRCANTEIELSDDALTVFIRIGESVLPRLRASAGPVWTVPNQSDSAVDTLSSLAGTWVICEAAEPVTYLLFGDVAELCWGGLTWTITRGALARLLERARRAQADLRQGLGGSSYLSPDYEIADGGRRPV